MVIKSADVDTGNYTISFDCWTPVRLGEMTRYNFAWLSDVSVSSGFPTANEVAWGYAGGGGIGVDAAGYLPVAPKNGGKSFDGASTEGAGATRSIRDMTKVKERGINSGNSDHGNKKPADWAWPEEWRAAEGRAEAYQLNKKTTTTSNDYTPTQPTTPNVSLPDTLPEGSVTIPMPTVVCDLIDLAETVIMDSTVSQTLTTRFNDILGLDTDVKGLVIKTKSKFSDGENVEKFDFKFDDEGGMWGAGTAFLQPEGGEGEQGGEEEEE